MYNLNGGLAQNISDPNSSVSTYHYMYSSGPPVIQNSPYYYSSHNERLSNIGVGNGGEWQSGGQQLSQEREALSKDKVPPYRNKPQLLPTKDRAIDKTSFNKSSPHFFPSQPIEGGTVTSSSSNLIGLGVGSQTSIKDNEKISQIQKIYNNNIRSRHNLHKSQNNFYNTHSNAFFNSVSQSLNSNANGSLDMRQKKTRQNTNRISQSPSTDTKSQQQQQQSTQQLNQLPISYPYSGSKRAQQLVKTAKQLSPPLASFQKENSNLAGLNSKEFKSSRSSVTVGKKEILITSAPPKQPLKGYLQTKPTQQSGPPSAFFSSNGSTSSSASKFYQTEPNFHKKSSKKLFPYSNQTAIKTQLIPIEDLIVNENMASSGQIGRKYFTSQNTQPLGGSSFFSVPPKSNSFFSTSAQKLAALNPKVNDKPKKIESIASSNTNSFQRNLLSNEFQQICNENKQQCVKKDFYLLNFLISKTKTEKSKTSEVTKRAQIASQSNDEDKKISRQLASLETQQLYNYDVEMDEPLMLTKYQQVENQNIIQIEKKDEKNNTLGMKDRRNNTNNSLGAVGLEVILEHHKEDEVREVPLDLIQQVQKISEARPKTSEGGRRRRKLRQAKQEKDTFDCFIGDNNLDTKQQGQEEEDGKSEQNTKKIEGSRLEMNLKNQQNIQEDKKEQGQLKGSPKRLDFSPLKSKIMILRTKKKVVILFAKMESFLLNNQQHKLRQLR